MLRLAALVVLASLTTACNLLLPTRRPPVTWAPLPTVAMSGTGMPMSATPIMLSSPTALPTLPIGDTATPTMMTRPTRTPTPTRTPADVASRAAWVRDVAWEYLRSISAEGTLPSKPIWEAQGPEAVVGATRFQYRFESWQVAVKMPVVLAQHATYEVQIEGPDEMLWEAQVSPDGSVIAPQSPPVTATGVAETPEQEEGGAIVVVDGWRGTLHALPQDASYDDYFRILGGEGGQYGIEGASSEIEERLAALRDSGRVLRVWGGLLRDVADYGGALIVVDRLEVLAVPSTPVPESEFVEGWVGVIRPLPPGSAYDDYFDAQQPGGQYGIDAVVSQVAKEIAAYRSAGTLVRIWGMLDYGVRDYGEKRIVVTRIEAVQ